MVKLDGTKVAVGLSLTAAVLGLGYWIHKSNQEVEAEYPTAIAAAPPPEERMPVILVDDIGRKRGRGYGTVGETYLGTPLGHGNLGFPAPSDWIPDEDIIFTQDHIFMDLQGVEKVKFANTGSMLPVLDENSTGIMAPPASPEEVKVGDIILYYDAHGDLIVHRVVKFGRDSMGWYAITKGDNNSHFDDPVRWNQVRSVLIGVMW